MLPLLELQQYLDDFLIASKAKAGQIFVLGCSTSEIIGQTIGHAGQETLGENLVSMLSNYLQSKGLFLAVQCCEHLNRALVVEETVLERYALDEVCVVPTKQAGGAAARAAYHLFKAPKVVENIQGHLGIDIGDTEIGMHIKAVQVPYRHTLKYFNHARLTGLYARPKLIGGARASYEKTLVEREKNQQTEESL